MPDVSCQHCQKSFYAKPYALKRGRSRYCSKDCYYAATGRRPPEQLPSEHTCGTSTYCHQCYVVWHSKPENRLKSVVKSRKNCGPDRNARRRFRYANDPDYRRKQQERDRRYREANREAINARMRGYRAPNHRSWNRRMYWEIAVNLLAERDGGACWVCQEPWTIETVSLDHVIPVYAGGTHAAPNMRLAHRSCNLQRRRPGLRPWNRLDLDLLP